MSMFDRPTNDPADHVVVLTDVPPGILNPWEAKAVQAATGAAVTGMLPPGIQEVADTIARHRGVPLSIRRRSLGRGVSVRLIAPDDTAAQAIAAAVRSAGLQLDGITTHVEDVLAGPRSDYQVTFTVSTFTARQLGLVESSRALRH